MNTKDILIKNNFIFKKKFGQNFLKDDNILNNIVSSSNITKETLVLEIGVGAGALTKKTAKKAKNVIGYEIDNSLRESLDEILSDYNNIEIIFDDFLKRDVINDILKYNYKEIVVVANLPYYITTPIIEKLINDKINISRIIIMVQDEVANRFSASICSKDYNSLTVYLNYYFNIKKLFKVSRNSFIPKPNVDSAVVLFERKNKLYEVDEEKLFKLIRDAFKQKRKTLKNNLKNYDYNSIDKVLKKYNKSITSRAEEITLEEFIDIANNLN